MILEHPPFKSKLTPMMTWRELTRHYLPGATDAEADYAWIHLVDGLFTPARIAEELLADWCAPYADPTAALRQLRTREWREK